MANIKVLSINISENEKDTVLSQYEKMGFEVINGMLVTQKNEHGTVTNTYYNYNLKFDRSQKNADKLWSIYKDYLKKKNELRYRRSDEAGQMLISPKTFFTLALIFTVVLIPFTPIIFGNGIFDFSSSSIFASSSGFDFTTFILSFLVALCGGFAIAPFAAMIQSAATRGKRMLLAIDRIPALENEIEELLKTAQELRS